MKRISFVIPCYCSERSIEGVVKEIHETMKKLNQYTYEIVLVNDASPDKTWEVIAQIVQNNSNVMGINFAKNFGQHAALLAGLRQTTGDIVVCLDDDGQTPACEVEKFFDKIENGADVVYASYDNKMHGFFRNFGSRVNGKMTEWLLGKSKDLYVSSYFAARRFVIDDVIKYGNSYPYVLGLVLRTTKRIENVEVNHRERQDGQSGYSLRKLISLWVNGFTSFSVKPLRFATFSGIFVAFIGMLYAVWTVVKRVINPIAPLGWSSTMAVLLMLGGMILFVLGMIGEYIGRIYISINSAPQYIVREELGCSMEGKEE